MQLASAPTITCMIHGLKGNTPQPNELKEEIWESPPGIGLGTKLGILGHYLHRSYSLDIGPRVRIRVRKVLDTQDSWVHGPASIFIGHI